MKNNYQYHRIQQLEKKYSEYNIAKGERLSPETRQKINHNYYQSTTKALTNRILTEIRNPNTVKEEVYQICEEIDNLKTLCRTCTLEQIISVIILYVQRTHNNKLIEEKTRLWNQYKLTWKIYSRIITRLLTETRRSKPL